jgi:hypothetical protein
MALDLERLDEQPTRWMALGGALTGVDVLVKYSGPREQERFRQKLIRARIMKEDSRTGGITINSGRDVDFFKAYAEQYIVDWRGDIKGGANGAAPPYSAEQMGRVLGQYRIAFEQIAASLEDETGFFSASGNDSGD